MHLEKKCLSRRYICRGDTYLEEIYMVERSLTRFDDLRLDENSAFGAQYDLASVPPQPHPISKLLATRRTEM